MELQSREAVGGGVFFKGLEQEFESTFGDLIPGIIHDFASPLNGILGRSELLGRRAGKTLERAMGNGGGADGDFLEDCKKIHGDAGLLAKEADRLFDLFNSVAEKFRMLKDRSVQEINLSDLVEAEAQFQWFYPGIKYDIKKKLVLDRDIPFVTGVKADYSIALAAIIRRAIHAMKDSEEKNLIITTGHDDSHVCVRIEDTGTPITETHMQDMLEEGDQATDPSGDLNAQKGFFWALALLKQYGALLQISRESGITGVSIRIPY